MTRVERCVYKYLISEHLFAVYMETTQQALIEIAIRYEDELTEDELTSLHWAIGMAVIH